MDLTRRCFLSTSAIALFAAGFVPGFVRRTATALETAPTRRGRKVLVALFLRGAADGLNVVVPHGDDDYYALRPTIAIPRPKRGEAGAAIDLDGFFGFHPSLAPLKTLYDARELAVVNAVGSPDSTRSHFDAQDYMESGVPGSRSAADGWLNRYLQRAPRGDATPFRAVAIAPRMPRTLQGKARALVAADLAAMRLVPDGAGPRAKEFAHAVEERYAAASDSLLHGAAREMFAAVDTLERETLHAAPPGGPPYPRGPLGKSLSQVAWLIQRGVGLEVAFVEVGGWDHHVNEGGAEGQLARSLAPLAAALAAFRQDLGDRMDDVLVLTMTEFGRTARENGNRGTDHGHASFMLALGGGVRGGKVHGAWPGLGADRLFEGRDLALTTDFRTVFAEALTRHFGVADAAAIFPGFGRARQGRLGLLA